MAQAVSRQAFLRQIEESSTVQDQRSWERSARFLQAEWPVLAALDQELVQDIAKLRSRLKRRSKMHRAVNGSARRHPLEAEKEALGGCLCSCPDC